MATKTLKKDIFPKIIAFDTKYGIYYYQANNQEELHKLWLTTIKDNMEEGYYQEDDTSNTGKHEADYVLKVNNGNLAYKFLNRRKNFEYEDFHEIEITQVTEI